MTEHQWRAILSIVLIPVFLLILASAVVQASEETGKDEKMAMAEVKKEMEEAMRAIKEYSVDRKDAAMEKAREALDKMDAGIDELEQRSSERWQQMSEASRERSKEALRDLRKKRNEIAEWYGGMKQSSAEAWEKVKKGFVDSYQSLQEAFDKAAEKF